MTALQNQRATALIEALTSLGIRRFIVSPGSRSTPLVWALMEQQSARQRPGSATPRSLDVTRFIDERCAAFYALGQARVSGEPSALLCTSGTAPAHYFPAVIEAHHAHLPLVVVSGDRPAELVGCGAPQTIDQRRLFGDFAHFLDVPELEDEFTSPPRLFSALRQAASHALGGAPGPIHINFRARKPLEPPTSAEAPIEPSGWSPRPAATQAFATRPFADRGLRPADELEFDAAFALLQRARQPWLIAGACHTWQAPTPQLVERYARLSGSRMHFEATSQLRFALSPDFPKFQLLEDLNWLSASDLAPDFVLQLGAPPMTPRLQTLLREQGASLPLVVAAPFGNPDPFHRRARLLGHHSQTVLEALCSRLEPSPGRARQARQTAPPLDPADPEQPRAVRLEALLESRAGGTLSEGVACRQLLQVIPHDSLLVVGNSLAPRHLDAYCAAQARGLVIASQRGVNGIDGVVSGALGAAACFEGPTTLLCGDVTFLHDLGALWAADPERSGTPRGQPLVMVVLNNDGGRIFEHLPVAAHPAASSGQLRLEPWLTPHGLHLKAAAELWRIGYSRVDDRSALRTSLKRAYAQREVHLIEVRVDPSNARAEALHVKAALASAGTAGVDT